MYDIKLIHKIKCYVKSALTLLPHEIRKKLKRGLFSETLHILNSLTNQFTFTMGCLTYNN